MGSDGKRDGDLLQGGSPAAAGRYLFHFVVRAGLAGGSGSSRLCRRKRMLPGWKPAECDESSCGWCVLLRWTRLARRLYDRSRGRCCLVCLSCKMPGCLLDAREGGPSHSPRRARGDGRDEGGPLGSFWALADWGPKSSRASDGGADARCVLVTSCKTGGDWSCDRAHREAKGEGAYSGHDPGKGVKVRQFLKLLLAPLGFVPGGGSPPNGPSHARWAA